MHFHTVAQCRRCLVFFTYTTPIPETLVLSSRCNQCGAWAMIGTYGNTGCLRCYELAYAQVLRLVWPEADDSAKA